MAARILLTTFDCRDAVAISDFWATALGYEVNNSGSNPPELIELHDPVGHGHPLFFVNVPEPKTVKNRVHLDLVTDLSMADEVERLVAAGAEAIAVHKHPPEFNDPYEWTVLRDPEGNEFCVGRPLPPN
jgi:catechol 2,3-dioxygenase-like lactoylglutathione lyase family enzyme